MITIGHNELRGVARRVFEAAGSAADEANIIADHMVEANLRGHDSHGVGLIPNYLDHLAGGTVFPNRKGRVVSEDGSLIVYDGERAWGQIAAREAVMIGIAKARVTPTTSAGSGPMARSAPGPVSSRSISSMSPMRARRWRHGAAPIPASVPTRSASRSPGRSQTGRSSSTWRRASWRWARCASRATRASR